MLRKFRVLFLEVQKTTEVTAVGGQTTETTSIQVQEEGLTTTQECSRIRVMAPTEGGPENQRCIKGTCKYKKISWLCTSFCFWMGKNYIGPIDFEYS